MVPHILLHAIAFDGGGRVALIIGAGCSVEAPTSLPLASALSREAERQLVLDGALAAGECPDPGDLAALASIIWQKDNRQARLVACFPRDAMRQPRPNEGYKLLAALMVERAIVHVLSLNFDRAVEVAAANLGHPVHVVHPPGGPVPLRPTLVYLHGSADSHPDEAVIF